MNDVAAIVVTYNRREILSNTIKKLLGQIYPNLTIIIVDNNSTDDTKEFIQPLIMDEKVKYINTGENLGGAGGFQFGIKYALKFGYKYLWLMDDDCYPESNALLELVNAAKELNDNFGFLSSLAYWTNGQLCNMNIQRKKIAKKVSLKDINFTKIIMATFVSFFVKSETIKKVGLPIKEFFIWSDDLEYSRRISKKNDCYLITKSKVVHAMKINEKVNIVNDSKDRIERYNFLYRNELYIYRREGISGIIYYMARVLYHIFKILISKNNEKYRKIRIILSSVKAGVHFNPSIEYV